jgi:hypothetical protein
MFDLKYCKQSGTVQGLARIKGHGLVRVRDLKNPERVDPFRANPRSSPVPDRPGVDPWVDLNLLMVRF